MFSALLRSIVCIHILHFAPSLNVNNAEANSWLSRLRPFIKTNTHWRPLSQTVVHRVARWFVFKPKIQIWVNFGELCNRRCWYTLWTLGPFYGLLLYFMDIWYSSLKFGIFFPFWYVVRRKIWQPWSYRLLQSFASL
jgi:hypothetical protein